MTRPRLAGGVSLLAILLAAGSWWVFSSNAPRYTVEQGDTLWAIARAHDVTLTDLRTWNRLTSDQLEVGDVLRVGPGHRASQGRKETRNAGSSDGPAQSVSGKAPSSTKSSPSSTRRTMPSPEPCVPFTADPGDEGMVGPEGIPLSQARAALNPVLQDALSCIRDPDLDGVDMVFEILVGCDGVVDRVTVLERGLASDRYARCVADILRTTDFPAHDLPDGETILYPVQVAW